jgi:hypothetical protein
MTAVAVPVMLAFEWGWLIIPLAANAAGAIAVLWMTMTPLAFPADVRLENHPDGVRILGRESDRRRALSVTAVVRDALAGAAVAAVGVSLMSAAGGPLAIGVLGVDSLTSGTPDTFSFLFSFSSTPTGISMSVGPAVSGAVVGPLYAFVRSYRRARFPQQRATDAARRTGSCTDRRANRRFHHSSLNGPSLLC